MRFGYQPGKPNIALMYKHGDEDMEYQIDWAAGILSGDSVSSVTSASLDSSNSSADATLLDSTTNSGTLTRVRTLTSGAGGTATATEGARFQIETTANLTDGGELKFRVYILIESGGTYGPTA